MTSLTETMALHTFIRFDDDIYRCGCGEVRTTGSEAWDHVWLVRSLWLTENGYGDPDGHLKPGMSCVHCGAVVGRPDKHREVCNGEASHDQPGLGH